MNKLERMGEDIGNSCRESVYEMKGTLKIK